jgi:DNA-binding response OmpR family regulator
MRRILLVPESLAGALPAALRDRPSFDLRMVPGARDVLEATARWSPELVIIGPELGEEEALALVRQLRADRRLADLRILLVSDAVPRGPVGAVIHAEVDAHVIGPSAAELLRSIGVLLDVGSQRPPRLAAEVLARVRASDSADPAADAEPIMANLIGLGETSCRLECEQPLAVGALVVVELALPGGEPLVSHALVLTADELQLHYGCELLDVDGEARARIRMLMGRRPAGSS